MALSKGQSKSLRLRYLERWRAILGRALARSCMRKCRSLQALRISSRSSSLAAMYSSASLCGSYNGLSKCHESKPRISLSTGFHRVILAAHGYAAGSTAEFTRLAVVDIPAFDRDKAFAHTVLAHFLGDFIVRVIVLVHVPFLESAHSAPTGIRTRIYRLMQSAVGPNSHTVRCLRCVSTCYHLHHRGFARATGL